MVLLAAHFCNWEWLLLTAGVVLKMPIDAVYKPQKVKGIDDFLRARRSRFGGNPIPHQSFMFEVMKRRKDVRAYALVADHTPKHDEEKHWTRFLNQDTAFFVGADKIAKILKAPVIYVAMRRDGPGRYNVELTLLAEPPYDRDSGPEIVERYARMLEQEIRRSPADWLWLHRKWKYDKPLTLRREVRSARGSRASACRCARNAAIVAHRRILEEIRDFEIAGVRRLHLLVDLRQRERAGAELEQVVVGRQLAVRAAPPGRSRGASARGRCHGRAAEPALASCARARASTSAKRPSS